MTKSLHYLPFVLFAALLPILLLRDFTPSNELRYLSIADEAIREGHLFAFSFQGEPYADKPPLYLWIVMLGKLIFGKHLMGFLALFSFVPAVVILRTMDRWIRPELGIHERLSASLMLMTSALFLGLAVCLRMDMLMCMFITLALRVFWRKYNGEGGRKDEFLFPLYLFLALFTKGPVGLLVPLLATVVFLVVKGRLKSLGRYWGWQTWSILLVLCGAWFAAVRLEGGPEYLHNLLFHQTLDRAVDAFHHKEPIWYYLVSVWYSLAPWSLLVFGTITASLLQRMQLSDTEQFFLCVALTTLASLSAFSSKLAVYLAPSFPFFIYLSVSLLARIRINGWVKACVGIPAAIWIGALIAIALLAHNPEYPDLADGWMLAASGVLCVSGIVALILLRRQQTLWTTVNTIAAGLLGALFIGGFSLPRFNAELGYGTLCRAAQKMATEEHRSGYFVWEIRRPEAMDVYLGESVRKVSAADILAGKCAGGVVLLSQEKLLQNPDLMAYAARKSRLDAGRYLILGIPDDPGHRPQRE